VKVSVRGGGKGILKWVSWAHLDHLRADGKGRSSQDSPKTKENTQTTVGGGYHKPREGFDPSPDLPNIYE